MTFFEGIQQQNGDGVELPNTTFEGVLLPVRTLYDALAWILTITAVPDPSGAAASQNNYFMPLLALLGRWSRKLLPFVIMPYMIHIAYWTGKQGPKVILGATPGGDQMLFSPTRSDDPFFDPGAAYRFRPPSGWFEERQKRKKVAARGKEPKPSEVETPEPEGKDNAKRYWGFRGWVVVSDRQDALVANHLQPPEGNALVDPDTRQTAEGSNYGVCVSLSASTILPMTGPARFHWQIADSHQAESFFYIYISDLKAKGKKLPKEIRGFALKATDDIVLPAEGETKPTVKKVGFARKTRINLKFIGTRVQQPCNVSCRKIVNDLNGGVEKGKDRMIFFMPKDMDPLLGAATDPVDGEDEDEPDGIPDEDPDKPGSSSKNPKEDNKKNRK